MKKTILILLMLKALFCFGQKRNDISKSQSIISLIANPPNYLDTKITIKGFLSFEKDDIAIYNSKDDYLNFNTKNAIYLILSKDDINSLGISKMNRKYVSIIGTFYISPIKNKQMGDNYIGALKNIEHVELIEQRILK